MLVLLQYNTSNLAPASTLLRLSTKLFSSSLLIRTHPHESRKVQEDIAIKVSIKVSKKSLASDTRLF
jgi:hypothetical protein